MPHPLCFPPPCLFGVLFPYLQVCGRMSHDVRLCVRVPVCLCACVFACVCFSYTRPGFAISTGGRGRDLGSAGYVCLLCVCVFVWCWYAGDLYIGDGICWSKKMSCESWHVWLCVCVCMCMCMCVCVCVCVCVCRRTESGTLRRKTLTLCVACV
jgi:hypothetical protein